MSIHKINGLEYGSTRIKGWFFLQLKLEKFRRGWNVESKLPGECPLHQITMDLLGPGNRVRWGCDKCLDEAAAFGLCLRHLWDWIHFDRPLPPDMVPHADGWRALAYRVKEK